MKVWTKLKIGVVVDDKEPVKFVEALQRIEHVEREKE